MHLAEKHINKKTKQQAWKTNLGDSGDTNNSTLLKVIVESSPIIWKVPCEAAFRKCVEEEAEYLLSRQHLLTAFHSPTTCGPFQPLGGLARKASYVMVQIYTH